MHQPKPNTIAPKRKSATARISLLFSCSSVIVPHFLGSIAGIVCGHMAMKEFARNPELEGRKMARWGLIIGYGSIVVMPLLALGFLLLFGGICGGGPLGS